MIWAIFTVWVALVPPDKNYPEAADIAQAIYSVVKEEQVPVFASKEEDAAVLAVFAYYESGLQSHPKPFSWDAKRGVSCGVWQEPCYFVLHHGLEDQVRWWLAAARAGKVICPSNPTAPLCGGCRNRTAWRMAASRVSKARQLIAPSSMGVL